ncbi:MAG: 4-hydroxybenzoate octaprenyltransferase [Pseudomonadota bacterium]|jgi:4-hydroxybenzoate polyprenyltransferase
MKLNEYFKSYYQLTRLDKPVGIWLLLFPTLTALYIASIEANSKVNLLTLVIFIFGSVCMRSAGCAINDYFDRGFDGEVERTKNRPLVKYPHLAKHALYLALILGIASGLPVLLLFNTKTIYLAIISFVIAGTYPLFKRFFNLPQAYLGLAFSMGIPMAYTAQNLAISFTCYLLLIANVLLVFAYDTAYAMVDRPYDLNIGIKTSAVFLGKYAQVTILIFSVIYWLIHAYLFYIFTNFTFVAINLIFGFAKLFFYDYKKLYSTHTSDYFKVFISNQYVVMFSFCLWLIVYSF